MKMGCDLCLHLTLSSVREIHNNLMGAAEKLSVENVPLFLNVQM